jgi:hypothetical protein
MVCKQEDRESLVMRLVFNGPDGGCVEDVRDVRYENAEYAGTANA